MSRADRWAGGALYFGDQRFVSEEHVSWGPFRPGEVRGLTEVRFSDHRNAQTFAPVVGRSQLLIEVEAGRAPYLASYPSA